jgi:hypothetical protein
MAYRLEASQTKNKIATHKMNTEVVYEHLKDVKGKLTFVDLPCKNFYVNDLANKKFKGNVNVIAYERDEKLYLELKHKNVVPKNIDYRYGDIFDMRGESIHWANFDVCFSVTNKNVNNFFGTLFGINMEKKSVLTINLVKQHGIADKDFKENGLQEQIVKILYRLGHKKVSYFTCEYRSVEENKKNSRPHTMIQSTFLIG